MEGFEHLVKVALENDDLIVASNLKFYVARKTRKKDREEIQRHGYEVDLVGARRDLLVLASVKSYFGSRGVNSQGFEGIAEDNKTTHFDQFKFFNYDDIRQGVIEEAAHRFGYKPSQVELRLYVGKFQKGTKDRISRHLGTIHAGRGPIKVFGLEEILTALFRVLETETYVNDPVVLTLKALKFANLLQYKTGPMTQVKAKPK